MKIAILTIIVIVMITGLAAQEFNVSIAADLITDVWLFTVNESLNLGTTLSVSSLHPVLNESIKFGIGISYLVPRTNKDFRYLDTSFSMVNFYGVIKTYPSRLTPTGTLTDYLYIKTNLGSGIPIIKNEYDALRINSSWGEFHYGFGTGLDFPNGLFLEMLYSCTYVGAYISGVGNRDGGIDTFSIA